MAVRAIRGATQVDADDREQVLEATRELVSTVMERNELGHDDVISILFTATPDLVSEFPALAARELGMGPGGDPPFLDPDGPVTGVPSAAGHHAELAGAVLQGVGGGVGVDVPLEGLLLVGEALGPALEVVEFERALAERGVQHQEADETAAEEEDDQQDERGAGRLPGAGREEPRESGGPPLQFGFAAHARSLGPACTRLTRRPP